MISLLVAMDRNHVIGSDNDLPWHLPDDLRYFKETTTGHTIIMGRKTFESIGRILPKRKHVVITRGNYEFPEEVEVIHDLEPIKTWNDDNPQEEYFVIGGGDIFKQVLPFADRLYITWIDEDFAGDTFFPSISLDEWELTEKTKGKKDEKNPYDYYYLVYERKNKE
ncbi:dihydrofolate reductase [Oceanobacillus indicireducens]|uniref:Dihydrofolate reductase n=1 Tax=Oceanobacillus indicireducens TaxID=1004261 RepID=A0A918D1D5_9BACI|nr:dihydrofolate reductase [Oceanobacillus indicireducens]GGN56207.1 dihydrofolate reductase [Oceanobacillus indicireducens]